MVKENYFKYIRKTVTCLFNIHTSSFQETKCINNVKEIGLVLRNRHNVNKIYWHL